MDGDAIGDSNTPAPEADDDFFSTWDKPAIKKPAPPNSQTATPPVVGRSSSPFVNANANGKDIARTASPLARSESAETKPAASRITHSAALKKTAVGPKKANVLGAKKAPKLGVKKVASDAIIDFDEAEKKAKEEAERIEKLGYDPEAEEEAEAKKPAKAEAAAILSPTPVSPPARGGYGSASHTREKSASEMARLGMGMGRLGFGQVGGNKGAAATQARKGAAGGFGSVGPIKAAAEGLLLPICTCWLLASEPEMGPRMEPGMIWDLGEPGTDR